MPEPPSKSSGIARYMRTFIANRPASNEESLNPTVCVATHNYWAIEELTVNLHDLGTTLYTHGSHFEWVKTNLDTFLRTDLFRFDPSDPFTGGALGIVDFVNQANQEQGICLNYIPELVEEILVDEDLEGDHCYLPMFLPYTICFTENIGAFEKYYVEKYIFEGRNYSGFMDLDYDGSYDSNEGWTILIVALYEDFNYS